MFLSVAQDHLPFYLIEDQFQQTAQSFKHQCVAQKFHIKLTRIMTTEVEIESVFFV